MNEIARVENPYASNMAVTPAVDHGAVAASDQKRAIAEVQAALVVAQSNPRDERRAMDRILNACQRKGLAERAIYSYAKGGSTIEGPSIHLARAIARNWGNIAFGIREMEQGSGHSVVQAFAWDQETNTREERVFSVPHQIQLKGGQIKRLTDPRDIYELVANMGARRERACILSLIPEDVVEAAEEQCNKTMRATADCSPEALQKMVAAFEEFGVVQQQIEARIQRRLDTVQPAQMVSLKKIYASLRDEMSQASDWFDPIEGDQPAASKGEPAKGNAAAKQALEKRTRKDPPADSQPTQATGGNDEVEGGRTSAEPEPVRDQAGSADTADQSSEAAESAADTDGTADDAGSIAPYLAVVRETRERIDAAQTIKAIDAIDREWTNTRRVQVAEADETAARSVDQAIISRKRELKAREG